MASAWGKVAVSGASSPWKLLQMRLARELSGAVSV